MFVCVCVCVCACVCVCVCARARVRVLSGRDLRRNIRVFLLVFSCLLGYSFVHVSTRACIQMWFRVQANVCVMRA